MDKRLTRGSSRQLGDDRGDVELRSALARGHDGPMDPEGDQGASRHRAPGTSAAKSGGGPSKWLLFLLATAFVVLMVAALEKRAVVAVASDIEGGERENSAHRPALSAGEASSEVHLVDLDSSNSASTTDAPGKNEDVVATDAKAAAAKAAEEKATAAKAEEEKATAAKAEEEKAAAAKAAEEKATAAKAEEEKAAAVKAAEEKAIAAKAAEEKATAAKAAEEKATAAKAAEEKATAAKAEEEKAAATKAATGKAGEEKAAAATPEKMLATPVQGYLPTEMVNVSAYVLPGTAGAPPLSAAAQRPYYPVLNHFQNRDPSSPYAEKWGRFDFTDPDAKWDGTMRPQPDFRAAPNRDVKNADFPPGAWQRDAAYMTVFLGQAKLLVNRSIEAVYAEYGVGIPQDGSVTLTAEQWANRDKFSPWLVKDAMDDKYNEGESWTTKQSLEGIARRFIHHIMTGDTFKLVLGGHSAAAGHGAGFNQSYIIEAGHVLEPVFAHLGVEMRAYNFAQGGLGTMQQVMAGMDLRGKETDWIMWDSRMTEKPETLVNFFLRQALISGNRSPVLMGDRAKLTDFHDIAGAAVAAQQGNGWIPPTESEAQAQEVPWAAQYLQCAKDGTADCKGHEYTAGCWVEREDFTPQKKQNALVGGRAGWHPGNRIHKIRGRQIALVVLRTLDYALDKWKTLGEKGYPIAEEHWHVNDYYKSIREKAVDVPGCWGDVWKIGSKRHLSEIGEEQGQRQLEGDFWPSRLCNLPLQGRSLFAPRHNPLESSLLSIMRPNAMGDIDPGIKTSAYMKAPCYQAPDRPAPWTVAPAAEPFAPLIGGARHLIVEEHKRRRLQNQVDLHPYLEGADGHEPIIGEEEGVVPVVGTRDTDKKRDAHFNTNVHAGPLAGSSRALRGKKSDNGSLYRYHENATRVLAGEEITPGLGLGVNWGMIGVCDGSSHHWCDKSCDSDCLMTGTQDRHGMICFNGLSGWLVFDVKNVQHGFIGARMVPWSDWSYITEGWTSVNNGGKGNYGKSGRERQLHEEHQERLRMENVRKIKEETEKDIHLAEGRRDHRRLGGGQSCGGKGDYTFEWAINGKIVTWTQAEFCNHFTRLAYNFDVLKFMDDETQKGDFEVAMRISSPGGKQPMCISHLYWS